MLNCSNDENAGHIDEKKSIDNNSTQHSKISINKVELKPGATNTIYVWLLARKNAKVDACFYLRPFGTQS